MLSADNARGLALPDDDLVLPFRTVRSDVVGRVIRLGSVVDTVLSRHAYPEPVSHALGEALALTAMLGSALKVQAKLILQTKTDGRPRSPGRRFRGARQGARLCELRQGRCRPRRSQGPRRSGRAAGQGPHGHDHRPRQRQGPLPGHRPARGRAAGGCRAHLFSPVRAAARPSSAWPWRGTTGRRGARASARGAGVPAG